MTISNISENSMLALVFNATPWANYADNAVSVPQTQIAVGLHIADPTDAGTMADSQAVYTSYARQNINRNSGGWTVSTVTGNTSVSPVANIDFPVATAGNETESFFSTGKTGGGSAVILFSGSITPVIAVSVNVTPRLTTATAITLD